VQCLGIDGREVGLAGVDLLENVDEAAVDSPILSNMSAVTNRTDVFCFPLFLSYPPAGFYDLPIPRRSGTTNVWFFMQVGC
jgi:hypothetical protein